MEDEIVNKDCYYKKDADNEFKNYSIHGLNIEGIKKYYLIPVNNKYKHMIQLNKDLDKIIENSKTIQIERRKKYDRDNIYDDERLINMYTIKKDKNNNDNKQYFNTIGNNILNKNDVSKSTKIFGKENRTEKPVKINEKIDINNIMEKEEINQNTINRNTYGNHSIDNNMTARNKILSKFRINKYSNSLTKKKNKNINTFYSLRGFNRSKNKSKDVDLPFIKPRKIIIEYYLTNDAGIESKNKNIGHNNYMGGSFNPSNYSVNPKNRNARNVYGGLFLH